MLLEIDAKMGLDVEMPPFNWRDFFDAESMPARVTMVQGWYATLMVRWEKRLKDEELQNANGLGMATCFPSLHSPTHSWSRSRSLSRRSKKPRRKADRDFMAHIIWEVLGDSAEPPELVEAAQPKPQLVPLARTSSRWCSESNSGRGRHERAGS
jgi:hypothetical protein